MQQNDKRNHHKRKANHTLSHLAAIGEISAGIAHEVKNPLTAVKGFLQLLSEEYDHRYVKLAHQELDQALKTLNNLLQVSKPDLIDEPYVKIQLAVELDSVVTLFQDQLHRVTVEKQFRDTEAFIYGKKGPIKKAFFNLLKNAFEAIEDKGIITLEHYVDGDHIYITIQDTGVGIPEHQLSMLGTPFFTSKPSGTGMGLAQVYATFNELGASIEVESTVNQGTKFIIKVPLPKTARIEVKSMTDLVYQEGDSFRTFIQRNKERFDERLHSRTESIVLQLDDHERISPETFEETAYKIIKAVEDDAEHELIAHARQRAMVWAKSDLQVSLKLEWFLGFREVYWDFLYNYFQHLSDDERAAFFVLAKKSNYLLDIFLNHFLTTYSEHTRELLNSQREVIDSLTVPVILLTKSTAILPIIGTVDPYRAKQIQEKTLKQAASHRIRKMIIDLSAVAFMDTEVVSHLFKIVEGLSLLGCKAIITGIRAEIANTMVEMGIKLSKELTVYQDLQQALEECGLQ